MPARHIITQKLPAVSGSSGRLVVERRLEEQESEGNWPGRVFEDEALDYSQAMLKFVSASGEAEASTSTIAPEGQPEASLQAQRRALRQEEEQLRTERRAMRQRRQQENVAWKALRAERKHEKAVPSLSPAGRKAQDERWRALRQHRRVTLERHEREDETWRQQRFSLRQRWSQLPVVTDWVAILVITDNCTRQCPGLPLFIAGSKVTAEIVVEALRVLLPPELQFVITDRGTHFTAKAFEQLAHAEGFIHVLIARHRPQSNGIAERFVRTLKEWLMDKAWHDDQLLAVLLKQFLAEYNDRPHQGLPIPGLSPNEFANRIWLM